MSKEIVLVPEGSAEEAAETVKDWTCDRSAWNIAWESPEEQGIEGGVRMVIQNQNNKSDIQESMSAQIWTISMRCPAPSSMHLRQKDQTLLEMTLKKANLEDVFLELTEKEEADDDSRI